MGGSTRRRGRAVRGSDPRRHDVIGHPMVCARAVTPSGVPPPTPPWSASDHGEGTMQQPVTIESAMTRAVELAARGLGRTAPNPVVGCIILDADGRIVGEG